MLAGRFYRVSAEINLDNIRYNINNLKKRINKNVKTCLVIKADGYGHGAVEIAHAVDDLADFYAVATLEEAIELRNSEIFKPILVLGYIHHDQYETAVANDVRLTVFGLDMARKISKAAVKLNKTAKIHIKVDTGMSRIGFEPEAEAADIVQNISKLSGIEIEGLFTHFANADAKTMEATEKQLKLYKKFISLLEEREIRIPVKHCSNSAATTNLKEANFDMVRMGVSIYGMYPSEYVDKIKLKPALSLKSHIVMVKNIKAGTSVGYGSTWTASEESVIATIPIGYADGYMRSLSNKGIVIIKGHRCRIVGRVCMDCLMVDVTGVSNVKAGDEVVLIGKSGKEEITIEELSGLAGSFNYEFACNLGNRIPRRYFLNKKEAGVKDYFSIV